MRLFDYLGCAPDHLEQLVKERLIDRADHPEFPLALLCYGRKTVYDNFWDSVTTKCRGLIYNTETLEIVARPFEKFFNYSGMIGDSHSIPAGEPEIYEKLDGFLAILYRYNGEDFIASKGSFTSPHAKWATAWLRKNRSNHWPSGFTPVFEGINRNLRIVVDYGEAEELQLLALVNNETGEELAYHNIRTYAEANGMNYAPRHKFSMAEAVKSANEPTKNFEGYVLVWRRPGQLPFRLKVKFLEYLRLHRFVTQVSPKRIVEALENGWDSVLDEYVENSTPWFSDYVNKWRKYFQERYNEIEAAAQFQFTEARGFLGAPPYGQELPTRKAWAELFTNGDAKKYSAILFAILDGKEIGPIIWKKVRDEVKGGRPMVDAHM